MSAPARIPTPPRRPPPSGGPRGAGTARTAQRPSARVQRPAATAWTRPRLVASRGQHAPARTGPRRAPFVLLVAGLLVGGLCALLALNTATAAEELRRQSLAQSNDDISGSVQQLQADLAARQAPSSLGSAAAALGMVPADHPAFLTIRPNGKVTVLGSAQPAAAPPAQVSKPRTKPSPKSTPTPTRRATTPPTKPRATSTVPKTPTRSQPSGIHR
jgi:hypothetical protein